MKKMEEKIKSLQYKTKANDVDEKGIVTVAVNPWYRKHCPEARDWCWL